jgi:hypothetical protein
MAWSNLIWQVCSSSSKTIVMTTRQVACAPEIATALRAVHNIIVLVRSVTEADYVISWKLGVLRVTISGEEFWIVVPTWPPFSFMNWCKYKNELVCLCFLHHLLGSSLFWLHSHFFSGLWCLILLICTVQKILGAILSMYFCCHIYIYIYIYILLFIWSYQILSYCDTSSKLHISVAWIF